MSKKEAPPPPLEPGDFQLDPANFKTGNGLLDMALKGVITAINEADLNHDHKRDIAEYAPIVEKALPVFMELSQFIDVPGIVSWVKTHPEFFKLGQAEAGTAKLEQLAEHVVEIAEVAPKV